MQNKLIAIDQADYLVLQLVSSSPHMVHQLNPVNLHKLDTLVTQLGVHVDNLMQSLTREQQRTVLDNTINLVDKYTDRLSVSE